MAGGGPMVAGVAGTGGGFAIRVGVSTRGASGTDPNRVAFIAPGWSGCPH